MIVGESIRLSSMPSIARRQGAGKYADIIQKALLLPSGEALPITLDKEADGKYASNNLVFQVRKGAYADKGLDAVSRTVKGVKTVYLIKKA
jgi:hypothetical protein